MAELRHAVGEFIAARDSLRVALAQADRSGVGRNEIARIAAPAYSRATVLKMLTEDNGRKLAEGDTLVLRVPDGMDYEDEAVHIAEQVRDRFPGHPIVVLAADVKLEVVRPVNAPEGQLVEVDGVRKQYVRGGWIEA